MTAIANFRPEPAGLMAGAGAAAGAIVLLADPWLTVALAVAIAMVWLGWSNPAIGLGVVAVTIPLQEALLIPLGTAELTVTQLTILPFIAGWLAAWLLDRTSAKLTPIVVVWGLVTAALALSIVGAVDKSQWAMEIYRWAIALALLAVATTTWRTVRATIPVLIGVSFGILISFAKALLQVIRDDGPASFSSDGVMRAYGFFGEPNPLAAYLEMSVLLIAPLGIVLARRGSNRPAVRYGLLMVALAGTVALLLTQSRGGLLGFVAGACVIAWLLARWSRLALLVGILIAIPVLTWTDTGQSTVDRFVAGVASISMSEQTTPENWAVQERVAHWRAGLNMIEDEPLSGIGAGNFDQRYREFTEVWRFRIPRGHAHSNVVQVGAQAGLVGVVAYLALFFVAGARIARGVLRAPGDLERALALGAMGVLFAVAVHGLFDYLHGLSLNLALVIALASCEPALNPARNQSLLPGADA